MSTSVSTYKPETQPLKHQQVSFDAHKDDLAWGRLWEQGCGKTKPTIDEAAYLYELGRIDAMIVLAPNGVHRNWVVNEIPKHLPKRVRWRGHYFQSSKSSTKWHKQKVDDVTTFKGLAVLCMSYQALMTEEGRKAAKDFMTKRRCLFVADESSYFKSPDAKRTKRILNASPYAQYRRILNGTPVANKPFDLYTQLKFLDDKAWQPLGIQNYAAFKAYFAVWQKEMNRSTGKWFETVKYYKNLDKLSEVLKRYCERVLKKDVLDLPPKVYSTRYFDLNAEQSRVYNELTDNLITQLSGTMVAAPLAIVMLLRLQQVTCGYLPDDDNNLIPIGDSNPRLNVLEDIFAEDPEQKTIVWARFKQDINLVVERLEDLGLRVVRYDGSTSDSQRAEAIRKFQDDNEADVFVANPQAAGTGLTLHAATRVIYYSNSFNYQERIQSEDRAHRIGQTQSVTYIDIAAADTVDERIIEALLKKYDIACKITGDVLEKWIKNEKHEIEVGTAEDYELAFATNNG